VAAAGEADAAPAAENVVPLRLVNARER